RRFATCCAEFEAISNVGQTSTERAAFESAVDRGVRPFLLEKASYWNPSYAVDCGYDEERLAEIKDACGLQLLPLGVRESSGEALFIDSDIGFFASAGCGLFEFLGASWKQAMNTLHGRQPLTIA